MAPFCWFIFQAYLNYDSSDVGVLAHYMLMLGHAQASLVATLAIAMFHVERYVL